jgi:bifunctional UDP-N-acetylglucosamine pyrophosphorylase/glucosamine-1-phosphate N-acetyltransferase
MTQQSELALLVLAAGKGTRMRSRLAKVLHPVCGRPLIQHAIGYGHALAAGRIVVVIGADSPDVREAVESAGAEVVVQREQLGTGHAVQQARDLLADHAGPILVMYGDHPLFRPETLRSLMDVHGKQGADLALLTGNFPDPSRYGRIVRAPGGAIERIVEEVDASPEERDIREINLGVYVVPGRLLFEWVGRLSNENEQSEYYLTDIVDMALAEGRRVDTSTVADWTEALGLNDRVQLAEAERVMRRRLAERWMREGVTFVDPATTYLEIDVEIGPDTVIEPGVSLRGRTRIGRGCRIAAGCVIDSSTLGDDVHVKPQCWLEGSTVGDGCVIGPSAHLRPDCVLEQDVRIGNYVEIKNSHLGAGTKADHLSYIGDADVGAGVSFGCGTIVVNYDSAQKHRTVVEDGVFIGCNSNLISPVRVEADAYIAAGSTITNDVPGGALAVARGRQRNVEGWRERRFGKREED